VEEVVEVDKSVDKYYNMRGVGILLFVVTSRAAPAGRLPSL
jgi:hypothetical protein